jgi:alpha-1,2-mannosyltransferase
MQPLIRQDLRLVAGVGGSLGLLGWAFYLTAFYREPSQDWMVFYTAATAYWEGNLPIILDGDRLTDVINGRFSAWLSWPLPLHPWLYPPHFLLYLLPFGLFPPALSCALFLLVGFAILIMAISTVAHDKRHMWTHVASLALCPAAAITVCLGQNAFLTSALLVGGFGVAGRRPLFGGMLLGALTFKPQLWLLVPVALVGARQWRAIASAVVTALFLVGASLMIFGVGPWRAWLDLMILPSAAYESWVTVGRLNGQSVYACATLLGASKAVADIFQILALLFAAGCVFWIFRRPIGIGHQISLLLAATTLAAPHIIGYDAVMLAIASTLLLCNASEGTLRFGEAIIAVVAWLSPLVTPPSVFWPGLLTPVVICLLIGCTVLRVIGGSTLPFPTIWTRLTTYARQ